jgi:large subunit ribosomal protein L19
MALALSAQTASAVRNSDHITPFQVGDSVILETKIQEGDKTRIQKFKGIVISISGRGENRMFTVRHISAGGIGVERTFPVISPWIQKISVEKQGEVRRAKLYYMRKRKGKSAKVVKAKIIIKAAQA